MAHLFFFSKRWRSEEKITILFSLFRDDVDNKFSINITLVKYNENILLAITLFYVRDIQIIH